MLPPIVNEPEQMARKIAYLLPGNHPDSLRALSFSFSPYQADQPGQVILRAHFFNPPPEDDIELIQVLETELYAQTDDKFEYAVEAQVTPIGTNMDFLPHIAWIDEAQSYRRNNLPAARRRQTRDCPDHQPLASPSPVLHGRGSG